MESGIFETVHRKEMMIRKIVTENLHLHYEIAIYLRFLEACVMNVNAADDSNNA